MRFTRDKAGYENTYVVESDRRRGRSRTRVLYWFRTPPGVKVGRAALDEDAIRRIEELNPGVEFDWPRILKGQGAPATETRPPAETRRQRPDNRRSQPQMSSQAAPAARPLPPPPAAEPPQKRPDLRREAEPIPVSESSETAAEVTMVFPDEVPTPAHARIGAAGVQQLRARYADLVARIAERPDETRRAELKGQADRLNPDSWVTDEQVSQGLEQYESVLASLREVAGQKRRRRRRGKGPRPASGEGTGASAAEPDDFGAEDAAEPDASPGGEPGES